MKGHPNAIGKFLRKLGYSHKKKSLVATERRRTEVRRLRENWFKHRIPAVSSQPERVVFFDETSVKTNLTRLRGCATTRRSLVMDAPFGSWGTQTFIAGLTADAIIAPWVIKGAMDGPSFAAYVEKVLVRELAPGTVRQMEDRFRELVRQVGRKTLGVETFKKALDKSRGRTPCVRVRA